ncbi:porin family protein [uncultured Brevundimonas sp.]|uniref:porin family protein n=1 Tax=uncultured Brevundimonas sp. TaxID=213418 RepID=UPI0026235EB6|nr:porin family protein [uncultured Brevundimonas sp.]
MKMLTVAAACAALLATPAVAQESGRYIQANLGGVVGGEFDSNFMNQDADNGYLVSVAYGQSIAPKWSIEGELVYADAELEGSRIKLMGISPMSMVLDYDMTTLGLMANANYEIYRSGKNAAYVGAGVGFGEVEYKPKGSDYGSSDDTGIMWQLKAGATRELNEKTTLDIGYRYLVAPEVGSVGEAGKFHTLTVGLRRAF